MDKLYYKTFYDSNVDCQCNILIISSDNKTDKLHLLRSIVNDYLLLPFNKRICGFDLEYSNCNKGNSSFLIQIALFFTKTIEVIFINPYDNDTNDMLKSILLADSILIGHGTESLDIPEFTHVFSKNEMKKIINSLNDTRYMCEYLNVLLNEQKSNLYYCYERFNVVSKEQIDMLNANVDEIGKFWNRPLSIDILLKKYENVITYAMFDVIYLQKLFINLCDAITKNLLSVSLINSYTRLKMHFLIGNLEINKDLVNSFNCYMYETYTLKSYFDMMCEKYLMVIDHDMKIIMEIKILRKYIYFLLHLSCYVIMCNHFPNILIKTNKPLLTEDYKVLNDYWLDLTFKITDKNVINFIINFGKFIENSFGKKILHLNNHN